MSVKMEEVWFKLQSQYSIRIKSETWPIMTSSNAEITCKSSSIHFSRSSWTYMHTLHASSNKVYHWNFEVMVTMVHGESDILCQAVAAVALVRSGRLKTSHAMNCCLVRANRPLWPGEFVRTWHDAVLHKVRQCWCGYKDQHRVTSSSHSVVDAWMIVVTHRYEYFAILAQMRDISCEL